MENKYTQQEISEQAKKRAANYMSLKGALESKNSQYVEFSNPNANKITSGTTNKPLENKQTAVEWLVEKIQQANPSFKFDALIRQAKEMEKEQITDAFGTGCQVESKRLIGYQGIAEQYYNETYKSK